MSHSEVILWGVNKLSLLFPLWKNMSEIIGWLFLSYETDFISNVDKEWKDFPWSDNIIEWKSIVSLNKSLMGKKVAILEGILIKKKIFDWGIFCLLAQSGWDEV